MVKRMNEQTAKIIGSPEAEIDQKIDQSSNERSKKQKGEIVDSPAAKIRQFELINGKDSSETESSRNNEPLYWHELISEIRDIFKSVYQKYHEKSESDVNSKTLTSLKHKLHDLAASRRPFKWLDVGCGYGRALDVLDAVDVSRNLFEYHGIDAVFKYLDDAEKQTKKYGIVNPKIEKKDASQMEFDSEFDLISAVLLLHEVDPLCLPYVIKNMLYALKPDGTLVISDFQGPYEQEDGVVAWSARDIELLLESICDEARISFESIPADKYPEDLGFYACYIKKSGIDDKKFKTFIENYHEFLEQKKNESKNMRNKLREEMKERVEEILGRSDIDTKNISEKETERIKSGIGDEYGVKAYQIRLLDSQIIFLDCKMQEFKQGTKCAGLR